MASAGLSCGIAAQCQLSSTGGKSNMLKKAQFVGMELVDGSLVIVVDQGADAVRFPLLALKEVHTKFKEDGRVTFMFAAKKLFIAKADPGDLNNLLTALNEAVGGARSRGKTPAPIGHSAALLERFFPDQMKKHKRALREVAAGDAPLPQAGHTQIMAIIDGKGRTPSAVGRMLAEVASSLGLTTHADSAKCHAESKQAYAASCRDASKATKLGLSVRACTHHKIVQALYAEIDVAAGVDCAALRAGLQAKLGPHEMVSMPHGAFKERLAEGLLVHIRHGLRRSNRAFCSRLELRWGEMDAEAAPLGICEVEYFEHDSRAPAPTCVLLRLNREPCASWSQAHNDRKPSLLATSLVSRLEIFCLRLSATASSTVARPRLLVAGWLPEVDTAPFVKRGFSFNQEPYASGKHAGKQGGLGFKMLKTDADRAKALTNQAKPSAASDSPAQPPLTAHQGKRKRPAAEEDGAPEAGSSSASSSAASSSAAAGSTSKFEPWPARKPASGTAAEEAAAPPQPSAGHGGEAQAGHGGAAMAAEMPSAMPAADEVGEAPPEYSFGGGDDDEEAIELGELSDLGRAKPDVPNQAAREAEEALARTQGSADVETQAAAVNTEGMDDIDAMMAEMV